MNAWRTLVLSSAMVLMACGGGGSDESGSDAAGGSGNGGSGNGGSGGVGTLQAAVIAPVASSYTLQSGSATITLQWSQSGAVKADTWDLLLNGTSVHHAALNGAQSASFDYTATAAGLYQFVVRLCQSTTCVDSSSVNTIVEVSVTPGASISNELAFSNGFFAPFVDATGWPPFDLTGTATHYGIKRYVLGFVVAKSADKCEASWGTYYNSDGVADNGYTLDMLTPSAIKSLQDQGVNVMVSFGGAANIPLDMACKSVDALKAEYKRFIEKYGFTHVDFDVEGMAVADPVSITRRAQALAALQAEYKAVNRKLHVWFTLPVLPTGLDHNGQNVLNAVVQHNVDIDGVNIMAMDYGDSAAPHPANYMGEYAIEAATGLHGQIKATYSNAGKTLTDAQAWAMVGVTPMIGVNDVISEIFELDDARQLLAFAKEKSIGMLSMWSANRDKQCDNGRSTIVSITCSSVLQNPMEFSSIFNAYNDDQSSGGNGGGHSGGNTDPVQPATPVLNAINSEYTLQNGNVVIPLQWNLSGEGGDRWQLLVNDMVVSTTTMSVSRNQSVTSSYTAQLAGNYRFMIRVCRVDLCADSNVRSTVVKVPVSSGSNEMPATPTLAWLNPEYTLNNGSVSVTIAWDMWWGVNGARWELLINNMAVHVETLIGNSPNAQHGSAAYTFTAAGNYSVQVRLCNGDQCADSAVANIVITSQDNSGGGSSGGGSGGGTGGGGVGGVDTSGWPQPLKQFNEPYQQTSGNVIAVYFAEWGIYGRNFHVADIPAQNVTHVLYAFLGMCGPNESMRAEFSGAYNALQQNCASKQDYEVSIVDTYAALEKSYTGDKWDDPVRGNFGQLRRLKAAMPNLHIMPSIGGWSMSEPFFTMAGNDSRRAVFVNSVEKFLRQYDFFDGVDIDWEYPGGGGLAQGSSADRQNYVYLMRDLRAMMDKLEADTGRQYQLTSAVGASENKIAEVNYAEAVNYMDYVFAMTYDFYGAWSGTLGHHAGLYPANNEKIAGFNTDYVVNRFVNAGVPMNKLVIGAAMYGRGWKGVTGGSSSNPWTGIGNGGITGSTAQGIWEAGSIDYKGIESYFQGGNVAAGANGFVYGYDDIAQAPYLWNFGTGELITFDDPRSVKAKAAYVKAKGLAGFLSWEIDGDNGHLLNAMNEGLGNQKQ